MDWYRQFFACSFLREFPSSIALSSFRVLRSIKFHRVLSLSGETARDSVLPSNAHPESDETSTSHPLTYQGVSLVVGGPATPLPNHKSVKYRRG